QRNPLLHSRAEQVRAIQMASARHNIEGATRLSERDGAGALMMAAADRVLLLGQTQFIALASFPTGSILNRTFGASVGQRVRVVMAYSHKGASTTQPSSDLDMRVLRPGGASVGTSLSFDNTYEIVEFFAPVTGVYTIRINSFRGSAGTEFIGWAVSRFDS
ncbi:MAG TPA: PPC domain-containing protein, partial [Actinomycetota bacterium]|nr:PPC domain-containing protein [Actinomycetota bacterium]